MTMQVRAHKPAVGGYGATPQPAPVGHEAKTPKAGKLEQQPDAIGAKYHADGFDGAKHCKGGHAAEGKKQRGHKKDQPGGVTPPAGQTPPAQGTPPVGDPAVGTPEQGILKAVQEIASTVEKLIEALGGQPPEQQAPGAPAGNTGIVPPGAVQGAPAQNTGVVGTPPVSATPYPV